jgi:fatty acid desaturase
VVASGLVLLAVTSIFDMPLWLYFAAFSYPGLVFGMVRSFTEHRWSEHAGERTAIVESNWIFGLLFLWNNLHAVHHSFPTASWYRLPRIWRDTVIRSSPTTADLSSRATARSPGDG